MSASQAPGESGNTYVSHMEDRLAATLMDAANEVAHTECFDSEQRAEVYTIIETLKANTETHRAMVKLLAKKLAEKPANA